MGQGTSPGSGMEFYRACGGEKRFYACLGSPTLAANEVFNETTGETHIEYPDGIDVSIPTNITEFFRSGVDRFQGLVSTIWDIEWRA
jgi:hypothetical protein